MTDFPLDQSLMPGARRIVTVCAPVQPGEQVLIVSDTARPLSVITALIEATREAGGIASAIVTPLVPSGSEPPETVRAAIHAADVVLAVTTGALYHTRAVQDAKRLRFLGLTAFTPDVLREGGIFADFPALEPRAMRLTQMLTDAGVARVTAPGGTDLSVDLTGRSAVPITGMAQHPGEKTGCPDIEAFIAPLETSANGVVVVDASASVAGVLDEPVRITVEQGRAASIEGGAGAEKIRAALQAANDDAVYQLAEFAFGLNPNALIRGVIVEDEGVAGTGHVALGSNIHFGGTNAAPLHLDFVFRDPTLWLDSARVEIVEGVRR